MVTNDGSPVSSENLVFFDRGNELEIVRRWFTARTVGRHLPAVFVIAFLTFFTYPLMSGWRGPLNVLDVLFFIVPLAAITLGFSYSLAAACLNRTRVVVSRESLSVRHGPVPWRGNFSMAIADIRFLHATHKKPGSGNKGELALRRIYEVHVYRWDGKIAKLVTGLDEGEQALQVVREMEKCSGLKPVRPNPQVVPQVEGAWW